MIDAALVVEAVTTGFVAVAAATALAALTALLLTPSALDGPAL